MRDKRDGQQQKPVPKGSEYFPQSHRHDGGKHSGDTGFGTKPNKRK